MRTVFTFVVLVLFALVSRPLTMLHWSISLVFFCILTGFFIRNGLKKIPANPPHKAILVRLGKRLCVVLNEGWNWFPCYPFVFSFILVNVEKKTKNFEPQEVRTPDNALLDVKSAITWVPGINNDPNSFINYLNSGAESGVEKILHNIVEDRSKTWARSNKEGPSNWMEAQANKDDAHEVLVKAILRENFKPIESIVPTGTWMRFFDSPQSEPTNYDASPENGWAHKNPETGKWNWNGLKQYFDNLPQPEQERLRESVDNRKKLIRSVREGNADFANSSLGITIKMFVVNEIKIKGSVAEAADKEETERREKKADQVEIENFSERATKLQGDHPNLSSAEALETVQVILGKVKKTIVHIDGAQTGLGHDLLGVASVGGLGSPITRTPQDFDHTGCIKKGKKGNKQERGKKEKSDDDFDENNPDAEWEKTFGDKLE